MKKILYGIWVGICRYLSEHFSLIRTNVVLFVLMIIEAAAVVCGHARIMLTMLSLGWIIGVILVNVKIGSDERTILDLVVGLSSAESNSVFVIVLVDAMVIWLELQLQSTIGIVEDLGAWVFIYAIVRIGLQGFLFSMSKDGKW